MADPPEKGPLAQNKGGGFRGGPKRWTGQGPRPARHIPWPEIFKHHLSLIEGHQKMIDMVRKHTVPGTGNHTQLVSMLESCKVMLQEAKTVSRTFVPPANLRDQVPLGSSSASMYPGYSPADHIYGTAAMEFGSAAAKARAQGIELKPEGGIEYEVGQGRGIKRKKLAEMRARSSQDGSGSGSGSGTDNAPPATNGKTSKPKTEKSTTAEESTATDQPAFFIDTEPTPVDLLVAEKASKKDVPEPLPSEETKPKKVKKKHEGKGPDAPEKGQIETEDIKAEVDERMKQKEEKRRKKEEKKRKHEAEALEAQLSEEPATASAEDKKRKRDSEGSSGLPAEVGADVDATEKPKKKKSKKEKETKTEVNNEATQEAEDSEKVPADTLPDVDVTEKPLKKKSKKEKEKKTELNTAVKQEAENLDQTQEASKKRPVEDEHDAEDAEGNKKKKKRKLRSSGPADA